MHSLSPKVIPHSSGGTISSPAKRWSCSSSQKRLRRIDVDVRATSLYFVYEDSAGNGINKTSGDRIVMQFADGKAETIRVYGGVEGQYFPEPMVRRRVEEYRLPGFLRLDTRPRMRASDLGSDRTLRHVPQ